jgi:hypothetical protein
MLKWLAMAFVCALCALGGAFVYRELRPAERVPDTPAVVQRIREVARLETLDVALYKKIDFAPDPREADSTWAAVAQWARFALRSPRGKAIVFADAHLSIDLRKLDERTLRADGRRVLIALPPLQTLIELRPGETEVIGSNLDSAETAQLLEHARQAFARAVESDHALAERARESARRTLRVLLLQLGFAEVVFVPELPGSKMN